MNRIVLFMFCLFCMIGLKSFGNEIDYSTCHSLGEMIAKETTKIDNTSHTDSAELAHLYVSRGESYMLAGSYNEALKDIQDAYSYGGKCEDPTIQLEVALNGSFCEVIIYDKLGMTAESTAAMVNFQSAADLIGCNGCQNCEGTFQNSSNNIHFRDLIKNCKSKKSKQPTQSQTAPSAPADDYSDIVGPNVVDETWCEETVVGTASAMIAIATKIGNFYIKAGVIATIEGLKERGLKCCKAGGLWKACVAPLARKWQKLKKDWENNNIRDGYILDPVGGHPYGII